MIIDQTTTFDNIFPSQLYFFEYHNPSGRAGKVLIETPLGEYEIINLFGGEAGRMRLNVFFPRGKFKVELDGGSTEPVYINWGKMPED